MKVRRLKHDPAEHLKGFETAAEARRAARQIANAQMPGRPPHLYLNDALERCGNRKGGVRTRCLSAACPVCTRAFRRWFTNEFVSQAVQFQRAEEAYGVTVTVILSGAQAALGHLHEVDLLSLRRRAVRALGRLKLPYPIIGGIDVSFNEKAGSTEPGHYQVHISFAVLGHPTSKKARKRLREAVEDCFRLEPTAPVPVRVRTLRDPMRQGSYLLKAMFSRRVSIVDRTGRRNTKKFPLKARHLAEIAMWLWPYQPLDRVLLRDVRLKRGRLVVTTNTVRKPKA